MPNKRKLTSDIKMKEKYQIWKNENIFINKIMKNKPKKEHISNKNNK